MVAKNTGPKVTAIDTGSTVCSLYISALFFKVVIGLAGGRAIASFPGLRPDFISHAAVEKYFSTAVSWVEASRAMG